MAILGYGTLRQPLLDPTNNTEIDYNRVMEQVDLYLSLGGRYFDTAYTYHGGNGETLVRKAVAERYPREVFQLTDKLPTWQIKTEQMCSDYFEEQLSRCGVDYFDYYFLHWLNREHYEHALKLNMFQFLKRKKQEGKALHIGFSYHDDAQTLGRILEEQPCIEVVQLQINYLDWESSQIQSKACYDVAVRFGKRVMVMEPCKGGTLANVPEDAQQLMQAVHPDWSPATWAIRFALSLPGVSVVLSGMNSTIQIQENLSSAAAPTLNNKELDTLHRVSEIISSQTAVPCTACRYCETSCPKKIRIPDYFSLYNAAIRFPDDAWKLKFQAQDLSKERGKATDCIQCHRCESRCPQRIEIPKRLVEVAALFS